MIKKTKSWGLIGVTALIAGLLVPTTAYASNAPETSGGGVSYSDQATLNISTGELTLTGASLSDVEFGPAPVEIKPFATGAVKTAGKCQYKHGGDDPHVTRGEVSSHGWWEIVVNNGCSEKAKVKTRLQAWGCVLVVGCGWVTEKTSIATSIKPGTARRANVRVACASTKIVGWRNLVDVDLEWKVDPVGWDTLGTRNLACSPR